MNIWQVTVDLDTTDPLTEDQVDQLLDTLEPTHGAALAWGPGASLSVVLTIETRSASPAAAAQAGQRTVVDALAQLGADVAGWRGAEALVADEADRRLAEPTLPELFGTPEAAELLGVSRQRVHQLREREDFPPPIMELGTGPLWTRGQIESFAEGWSRQPGRPALLTAEATLQVGGPHQPPPLRLAKAKKLSRSRKPATRKLPRKAAAGSALTGKRSGSKSKTRSRRKAGA